MTTVLLIVGLVWAYVFFGCIAYRVGLIYQKKENWEKEAPFLAGIFWPLIVAFLTAWLPIRTVMRFTNKMVGFIFSAPEKISARRNKVRLPIAKLVK